MTSGRPVIERGSEILIKARYVIAVGTTDGKIPRVGVKRNHSVVLGDSPITKAA